jgi:hypothetical protein
VSLADGIKAERERRARAAQMLENSRLQEAAEVEWISKRLYASPADPFLGPPPDDYSELVMEIVAVVPRRFWRVGYIYRDSQGEERLTKLINMESPTVYGIHSSSFFERKAAQRELGRQQTRLEPLNQKLHAQLDRDAYRISYLEHDNSFWREQEYCEKKLVAATWSFTVVSDGRVGARRLRSGVVNSGIFGSQAEIRKFLVELVLDADPG